MTAIMRSTSYRVRTIRSSVWQWVQPRIEFFCTSLPGKLANQSAFVSCAARSRAFRSLRSTAALALWVTVATAVASRSYPAARIRSAYSPGVSRDAGNRYRPSRSETTVTVVVDSFFFALTSTPSIGPSSTEETSPVSALPAESRVCDPVNTMPHKHEMNIHGTADRIVTSSVYGRTFQLDSTSNRLKSWYRATPSTR